MKYVKRAEIDENVNKDTKMETPQDMPEPGEEKLALLIHEAGKTAREQKKIMFEEHFRKIHLAVTGKLGIRSKKKQHKP
jgi:hypothetical protein